MEKIRDLAIVLRSVPYDERHRVVTALTQTHGRISALARNAIHSRRFGGCLELLVASEWIFVERPGADLYRVEETLIRRSFEAIRKDFQLFSLGSVFSELMLRFAPEREVSEELFLLHSNALVLLEEKSAEPSGAEPLFCSSLLNAYLLKLLQWSGVQPRLSQCLVCEKPMQEISSPVKVAIADAGWSCTECRRATGVGQSVQAVRDHAKQLSLAGITEMMRALSMPVRQAVKQSSASLRDHHQIFDFLMALMEYHMGGFQPEMLKGLRLVDLGSSELRH